MTEIEAVDQVCSGAGESGLCKGGTVLVHASLRSMGTVPGGAKTVVHGLLSALGPEGTLLMPALSYAHVDMYRPVFDVRRTPSNVGAIPEHFRKRPGTVRSIHPTHSVCGVGPAADAILGSHQRDESPCGANSPFRRLRDSGGQILFLGCGLKPNTSMHGVEELAEPPYLFGDRVSYRAILPDGDEIEGHTRRHGFAGWAQRYDRLGSLLGDDGLSQGKILEATVCVLECREMWERAHEALRGDPFYFVERSRR